MDIQAMKEIKIQMMKIKTIQKRAKMGVILSAMMVKVKEL